MLALSVGGGSDTAASSCRRLLASGLVLACGRSRRLVGGELRMGLDGEGAAAEVLAVQLHLDTVDAPVRHRVGHFVDAFAYERKPLCQVSLERANDTPACPSPRFATHTSHAPVGCPSLSFCSATRPLRKPCFSSREAMAESNSGASGLSRDASSLVGFSSLIGNSFTSNRSPPQVGTWSASLRALTSP